MIYNDFFNDLTIVFPIYNEEKRINVFLTKLYKFHHDYLSSTNIKLNIIFSLDGSTDNTEIILRDLEIPFINKNILSYKKNRGKGYCVHQALKRVSTKYVLISDFDLSTPLIDVLKLANSIESNDIVIGSRKIYPYNTENTLYRTILSFCSTTAVKILLNVKFYDTQCGFKLFKTDVAINLFNLRQIDRFGYDFEILYLANKLGYKVKELSVNWIYESNGHVYFYDYFKTLLELLLVRYYDLTNSYKLKNKNRKLIKK